jgi:formamidopyrimidine-DNA glycosylase
MPELAEVEFFRRRWHEAAAGQQIVRVALHPKARIFRGVDASALSRAMTGAKLAGSEAAAKQMIFRFANGASLGIHLGMSGELEARPPAHLPAKHDHLVLFTAKHALVFRDPRMFGRVQFAPGPGAPAWWTGVAPAIKSRAFSVAAVAAFLRRRARAPIKAVLLMQERFPGIGNWMADEVLWRAAIHPRRRAGTLLPAEVRTLHHECRNVCRLALAKIAGQGGKLPRDLNIHIPDTWLFNHRWRPGGICPRTHQPLAYATIGGRTTCWSPARQKTSG